MKFHVMSDLHLDLMRPERYTEFWGMLEAHVQADRPELLVLAGDIGGLNDYKFVDYRSAMAKFAMLYPQVVVIPGNHEYWGTTILDGNQKLRNLDISGINVLQPGVKVEVGGKTFTGGTLWFPDCEDKWSKRQWCDYDYVHDGEPEIHVMHQDFVNRVLENPGDIVVSHHFPNAESIAPEFRGAWSNIFFNADIDYAIEAAKAKGVKMPQMWIHGHTHNGFDFKSKHGFRTFCNPLGYTFEGRNPTFWDRLLVDTDDQGWYLKTFNGGSNLE